MKIDNYVLTFYHLTFGDESVGILGINRLVPDVY